MESKLTLHYLNVVLAPVTRVLLKSRTLQIFRLTSPPSYSSLALTPAPPLPPSPAPPPDLARTLFLYGLLVLLLLSFICSPPSRPVRTALSGKSEKRAKTVHVSPMLYTFTP